MAFTSAREIDTVGPAPEAATAKVKGEYERD